jgi:hypothetical protein
MVVSGTATFDSVSSSPNGGLDYTAMTARPIRGASVQLIDANGAVIAAGKTSASGAYSLQIAAPQAVRVRVRAELKSSMFDVTVRDNTAGQALYTMDSVALQAGGVVRADLHASAGWTGTGYGATRVAAPFALLDVAYQGIVKVHDVSPGTRLDPLQMFWSPNNRPVSGNRAAGEIGTSFFTRDGQGSRTLYILGAENTDTDEYDQPVVAHEFGHYLQNTISRDDSPGGPHSAGEQLDMRLAFSEGFGNAWTGMSLGRTTYHDSRGLRQALGFEFALLQPPTISSGWYNEETVQSLLTQWHAEASLGYASMHRALVSMASSPALTSMHSFVHHLKLAAPSAAASITQRAAAHGVNGTDQWGSSETNSAGRAWVVPLYKVVAVPSGPSAASTQRLCLQSQRDRGTGWDRGNRLGDAAYLRFTLPAPATVTIGVRRASDTSDTTDPNLFLTLADGTRGGVATMRADNVESLTSNLPGGTHTLELRDSLLTYPLPTTPVSQTTRCFDVDITSR